MSSTDVMEREPLGSFIVLWEWPPRKPLNMPPNARNPKFGKGPDGAI